MKFHQQCIFANKNSDLFWLYFFDWSFIEKTGADKNIIDEENPISKIIRALQNSN